MTFMASYVSLTGYHTSDLSTVKENLQYWNNTAALYLQSKLNMLL